MYCKKPRRSFNVYQDSILKGGINLLKHYIIPSCAKIGINEIDITDRTQTDPLLKIRSAKGY